MIKKTLCILLTMVAFAYAETHTVNPGGGADYTALETCLNAHEGTLSEPLIINCSGSTADTTAVVIHNYTTTTTNDIHINGNLVMAQSSALRLNESYYRLITEDCNAIEIYNPNVTIDKFQIHASHDYETNERICVYIIASGTGDTTISNSIFNADKMGGISVSGGQDGTVYLINNLIYKTGNTTRGYAVSFSVWNFDILLKVYNTTVYGFASGFTRDNGNTPTLKNCIANGCANGYSGSWNSASDYNASDIDSDAPGTNSRNGTNGDVTFVSVTAGSEDFHLSADDDNAMDNGTSTGMPTTDIDGDTRSGSWDIGCDEYVAAASPATTSGFIPYYKWFSR